MLHFANAVQAGTPKPEWFQHFTVTVGVYGHNGSPVTGSMVHAFSEDWGTKVPSDGFFLGTGPDGKVALTLPGGRWSIIAGGGDAYGSGSVGRAFFVFQSGIDIVSDTELTLWAGAEVSVQLRDTLGNPIPIDELWVTGSRFAPVWRTGICGRSDLPTLTLETIADERIDLLARHAPGPGTAGYLWSAKNQSTAGAIDLSTSGGMKTVFDPLDKDMNPTTWNIEFRVPNFDITPEFNTSMDFSEPTRMVLSTDTFVTSVRYSRPGWYLYFTGDVLEPGEPPGDTIRIGGPFSLTLRMIPEGSISYSPATQLWFDVEDAFGHILEFHDAPSGTSVAFRLWRDTELLYDELLPSRFTSLPEVFDSTDNLSFEAEMDFGEFDTLTCTGDLWAPEYSYDPWGYESTHFRFNTPTILADKNQRMVPELETMYDIMADMMGQPISERVDVNVDIAGQGFPGESIPLKVPLIVYLMSDHRRPASLAFMYHEMGHVRLLKTPLRFDPIMEFGESEATLVGNRAIGLQMDSLVALSLNGDHHKFFDHLQGEPIGDVYDLIETAQFILSYVEKVAGWEAHRDLINRWDSQFETWCYILSEQGYNPHEQMAVLYSCVAQQDLGWLFALAGFDVDTTKIGFGLEVIGCELTPPCACDCHADPQCDGVTTVHDVVRTVDVAFRGSAPIPDQNPQCPRQTTDVNCDGVTTVHDVVRMVNVAFRGYDPATEFCEPCGM